MHKSNQLKFIHVTFVQSFYVKCISYNSTICIENGRAYLNAPGMFLLHCPICTDNFDFKTEREYYNA